MIAKALLLVVLVALSCEARHRPRWHELSESYSFERYVADFGKHYRSTEEYSRRKAVFETSMQRILAHNSQPHASWRRGVNHLTDWTEEERRGIRGTRIEPSYQPKSAKAYVAKGLKGAQRPAQFDWRNHTPHVLTAVKDQGYCGDCWAHSVTESVESAWAIATNELYVLSQQQVTSCTPAFGGCYSCNGSFVNLGLDYVASTGITEEWVYPFESYKGAFPTCKKDPFVSYPIDIIVNISGFAQVASNHQDDFIDGLINLGPLAITADASDWPEYETGVFNSCNYAANISIDHAIQVVGFGTDPVLNMDYWVVRNSWSPGWGEEGFIRLHKQNTPSCGWAVGSTYGAYGCFNNVGPQNSWTCGQCGILFQPAFPLVDPQN